MTTASEDAKSWYDNRTLVFAWLLVFFPVGLFGLWRSTVFDRNWKLGLTGAVLVVFFAMGVRLIHPVYVFLLFPAALVLLWRSKDGVKRSTVYKFAAGWCVIFVLFALESNYAPPSGYGGDLDAGGSCAAVMTSGSCTYFRDSDCNVIAKQCE